MALGVVGLVVGLIVGVFLVRMARGDPGRQRAKPAVIYQHRATGREYRLEGHAIDGKEVDWPFPTIKPRYLLLFGPDGYTEVWKAEVVDEQFDRVTRGMAPGAAG